MKKNIQRTKAITDYISANNQLEKVKIPNKVKMILQQCDKSLESQVIDIRKQVRKLYTKSRTPEIDVELGTFDVPDLTNEVSDILGSLYKLSFQSPFEVLSNIVNREDLWKGFDTSDKLHGDGK